MPFKIRHLIPPLLSVLGLFLWLIVSWVQVTIAAASPDLWFFFFLIRCQMFSGLWWLLHEFFFLCSRVLAFVPVNGLILLKFLSRVSWDEYREDFASGVASLPHSHDPFCSAPRSQYIMLSNHIGGTWSPAWCSLEITWFIPQIPQADGHLRIHPWAG